MLVCLGCHSWPYDILRPRNATVRAAGSSLGLQGTSTGRDLEKGRTDTVADYSCSLSGFSFLVLGNSF